jgi:putative peptidoglycan lipid II flippase
LTAAQARQDQAAYSGMLDWGLRLVLLLALPCALALLLLPQALVAVLYHYGAFTSADVAATVLALQGYGVGLLALVAIKVLAPAFYARQDIRTPVKIAIGVLVATQLMNLVLVPWLGHAGLALSIGLAAWCNAGLLLTGLVRKGIFKPQAGWGLFALRVAAANGAVAAVLWWAAQRIDWLALQSQGGLRAGLMALVLAGVALVYFGVLALCGLRPRDLVRKA